LRGKFNVDGEFKVEKVTWSGFKEIDNNKKEFLSYETFVIDASPNTIKGEGKDQDDR